MQLQDFLEDGPGTMDGSVSQLIKSMQAGQISGTQTLGLPLTAQPLKAESLETSMKLLEYKLEEIKLFNTIPKLVAHSTVEEFLQLQSYGASRGGFYSEGELSEIEDSTYVRRAEYVKYIQVTGEVTIQAQMVRSFIDVMAQETKNKMMWVMRTANRALTQADSDMIPDEFNSLYRQHANIGSSTGSIYQSFEQYYTSGVVVDMRGRSLKQSDIENGSIIVDDNHGSPNMLFAPTKVLSAFSQDYYDKQRVIIDGRPIVGSISDVPKAVTTTIANINLLGDKSMKSGDSRKLTEAATSLKAPSAPTAGTGVNVPAIITDSFSKYQASESGNVFYAVASINKYGESAMTSLNASAVVLAAGSSVDLSFSPSGGANPASAYTVYRSKVTTATAPTGLDFFPIFKVSAAQLSAGYDGATNSKVRDRGYYLPGMEQCFLAEVTEDVMSFKQLAPMSKLDLAVQSMSRRFIVFLFGTPNLYAAKKMVRYINVSPTYKL